MKPDALITSKIDIFTKELPVIRIACIVYTIIGINSVEAGRELELFQADKQ